MRGIILGLAVLLVAAAPAAAQVTAPWDGSNPFNCTLQQLGYGTDYPDPDADPLCVEFDKRQQNITQLGIVDFLSKEPARVQAAGDKCFYYQHDHWTSYVVQDDGQTEIYNWDGRYFFDRARATGGAYVENFTFNNQTGDPRMIPGFPEEYKPFFGPGRGGMQFSERDGEFDPACAELARRKGVYRTSMGGPVGGGSVGCLTGQGSIRRGLPGARFGSSRARVLGALGQPTKSRRRVLRWCTVADGELVAAFARRLKLVRSTAPVFDLGRVAAGDSARSARAALRGERTLRRGRAGRVLAVRGRRVTRLVKLRAGRVQWVGSAARGLKRRGLLKLLRESSA